LSSLMGRSEIIARFIRYFRSHHTLQCYSFCFSVAWIARLFQMVVLNLLLHLNLQVLLCSFNLKVETIDVKVNHFGYLRQIEVKVESFD
jgi:hypothetical protein